MKDTAADTIAAIRGCKDAAGRARAAIHATQQNRVLILLPKKKSSEHRKGCR